MLVLIFVFFLIGPRGQALTGDSIHRVVEPSHYKGVVTFSKPGCVGTHIANNLYITAAHCLVDAKVGDLVKLVSHFKDRNVFRSTEFTKVITHHRYDKNFHFDVGFFSVRDNPLSQNEIAKISFMQIPKHEKIIKIGLTQEEAYLTRKLMGVETINLGPEALILKGDHKLIFYDRGIDNMTQARSLFNIYILTPKNGYRDKNVQANILTYGGNTAGLSASADYGDSGSPYFKISNGKFYVIGIHSGRFFRLNTETGRKSVDRHVNRGVRVSFLKDWIQRIISEHEREFSGN